MIGAGPIGCEMAQAFRRLGSEVVVLHSDPHILPREDGDAAAIVETRFGEEGVRVVLGSDSAASGESVDVLSETQHLAARRTDLQARGAIRFESSLGRLAGFELADPPFGHETQDRVGRQ